MDEREIEKRIERALEAHKLGFNCAQCVMHACCDLAGLDETIAFKMLEGFGGGMGAGTQTCGALSGAVAVVSFSMSEGPDNPKHKFETYKVIGPLVEEFRNLAGGSTICNEIKGCTGGPVLHSCSDCIADGVRLTVDALAKP